MRRASVRDPGPRAPWRWMIAAALLLGGLALARRWLLRPSTPPPTPAAHLDAAACVRVVAPTLGAAGCGSDGCHGAPTASLSLRANPGTAGEVIASCEALARLSAPGDPLRSRLYQRATTAHAGGAALDPSGCAAQQLARWIRGEAMARCVSGAVAGSAPTTAAPR